MTTQHLLLFTIGPVQSFIAQARKTQDLYAGSQILSELIKTAIDTIGRDYVVFPYAKYQTDKEWNAIESVPNRLVAILESETKVQTLGDAAKTAVESKWIEIAKDALHYWNDAIKSQIKQHLEIYWVAQELTDNYRQDYDRLERLMGAIKNTRTFKQYHYDGIGEQGRKCSLDGERNALFYRKTERGIKPSFTSKDAIEIQQNSNLDQGEALSAVSYVKRKYSSKSFPSTAEIALLDVLTKMNSNASDKICIDMIKRVNDQLFFEENVRSKKVIAKILKDADKESEFSVDAIEQCHKTFWKHAKKESFSQLKYYAILTFDGDSMGKWLSGDMELLPEKDNLGKIIDAQQFQSDFSEKLSEFTQSVKKIIDANKYGKTVYAGGDDYLGFVNLNYLFLALTALRREYADIVSEPLRKKYDSLKPLSFSAGVCIAHYKEPLSIVLQTARNMQDKAKETFEQKGKDAFAITVIKGSGEIVETIWKNDEAGLLLKILNYFKKGVSYGQFISKHTRSAVSSF